MGYNSPTGDFQTTSLSGVLAAAGTSATIGTGLTLPATSGVLQISYDTANAIGATDGPETIGYAAYNSGTGAITGLTRGLAGTTDVQHSSGQSVQCAPSSLYFNTFVGARATLAATIADTVASAHTKIVLDTETYDVGGNFATGKFTAPVNGYYQINAKVTFTTTDAKAFICEIYKDGAVLLKDDKGGAVAGDTITASVNDVVYLAATSYIELYYYHNAATTTDVVGGATNTSMAVSLIKEIF